MNTSASVFDRVLVAGDSFSCHPYDDAACCYPDYMTVPSVIENRGIPTITIVGDIEPAFATTLAQADAPDAVIFQGGVNDCARWDDRYISLTHQLWRMQSAIVSVTQQVAARNLNLMFINVAAWQEFEPWTPQRQQLTERYNQWLASFATDVGAQLIDLYSLLQDPQQPMRMLPTLGGPLHPNEAGARRYAQDIDARIRQLREHGAHSRPVPGRVAELSAKIARERPKSGLWQRLRSKLGRR